MKRRQATCGECRFFEPSVSGQDHFCVAIPIDNEESNLPCVCKNTDQCSLFEPAEIGTCEDCEWIDDFSLEDESYSCRHEHCQKFIHSSKASRWYCSAWRKK